MQTRAKTQSNAAALPQQRDDTARNFLNSLKCRVGDSLAVIDASGMVTLAGEIQDRETLERLVLLYLLRQPAAADTIEGVRSWWLRDTGEVNQALLRTVLDELSERGWLVTRGDQPENRIYSLNERARKAVERFAAGPGKPGERSDG
jgi:hypothetical protein